MTVKRYGAYKQSLVQAWGRIPAHWPIYALKRVASLKSGEMINAQDIDEYGPYPVFGGNGLRGYAPSFTHSGSYVLIGRQGALCGNINYAEGNFWASEHAIVASPRVNLATRWLGELLRTMNLNQYSVSAAQPGLSVETVSNLRIPVPPFEEQGAISAFLDRETARIDALIEKKRRLIELLQEKRAAVIFSAATKGLWGSAARVAGLDPHPALKSSGVDWTGDVPVHWDVGNLRRFAAMKTGHTPSRTEPEYWEGCDIPWFTLADVWQLRDGTRIWLGETKEKISRLGLENSAAELLPAGTVVFSRTASVGFSGIMPAPMATTQDFWNWIPGPRLIPEFLLYQFRAMTQEFEKLTMGSTHKTIYQSDAASIHVCVPPIDEQRAIVEFIRRETASIDSLVSKVEGVIERLSEYRSAVIAAAVTGQIDVREAA